MEFLLILPSISLFEGKTQRTIKINRTKGCSQITNDALLFVEQYQAMYGMRSFQTQEEVLGEDSHSNALKKYQTIIISNMGYSRNISVNWDRLMWKNSILDLTSKSACGKGIQFLSNHYPSFSMRILGKFSDLLSTYRLTTFKAKSSPILQKHLTILALAYDSGFNLQDVFQ